MVGMIKYRIQSIIHHCFSDERAIYLLCLHLTDPAFRRGSTKPGLHNLTEPGTDLDFKCCHLGFSIHD